MQFLEHCESFVGVIPELQQQVLDLVCHNHVITSALLSKFDPISHIGALNLTPHLDYLEAYCYFY